MRVSTVSISVRYSKQLADASYKTVELGLEASLTSNTEDWQEVQRTLYTQLGDQIRFVFNGNGSGNGTAKVAQEPAKAELPEPPAHFCQQHRTPFVKFSKNGRSWWSHKLGNGWCREA
jgi:hypothetical protein